MCLPCGETLIISNLNKTMMSNQEYIELLNRFMRGETSSEEKQALIQWFKEDSSQQALFTYYSERWKETSSKELPVEKQHQMLAEIKNKIHSIEKEEEKSVKRAKEINRFSPHRWFSYAAAIIITIGLAWSAMNYYNPTPQQLLNFFVVTAEKGQRASITLPDGTKVWLNSDSKISYDNRYGETDRRISLSGEAYFEVSKDKEHRFIVAAGGMEVEALGTTFNVKAYDNEDVTTTLFSGKVKASVGKNVAILLPSQYAIYSPTARRLLTKTSKNVEYAKMWHTNELAFDAATLSEIGATLSRIYNFEIVFASENIKKHRFTGVVKNNSLENVLQIISMTAPIYYQFHNDSIIWREKESKY